MRKAPETKTLPEVVPENSGTTVAARGTSVVDCGRDGAAEQVEYEAILSESCEKLFEQFM